jgi:hypothetical protein
VSPPPCDGTLPGLSGQQGPALTLVLHYCYNVVTLLLQYRHSGVTLLSHTQVLRCGGLATVRGLFVNSFKVLSACH